MDKVFNIFFCGLNFGSFHMDNNSSILINVPWYYYFLFLSCEVCNLLSNQ